MMRKERIVSLAGALLAVTLVVGVSAGQPPQTARTLMTTPFEKDANGWMTLGEKAKTGIEADTVTGKSSLRYDYQVEKSGVSTLVLPVNNNEISDAKAFRFAVKTDYPTTIVVGLQEMDANKEEGRYMATFYSPGGSWQEVSLAPTDFIRDENSAAKDTNNKLDMDKVGGVAITDLMQIIAQGEDSPITALLGVKRGAHQMWVRDFRITTETLPGAPYLTPTDTRLDTFAHPQVGWIGIGGMKLSLHAGRPIDGRGLKGTYTAGPGKIGGMARQIPVGRLAGKTKLQLGVASSKQITLVIQVEEQDGGKYNSVVEIPGGATLKQLDLPFADFKQSEDSKDTDGKLDTAKIKQILVLDASAIVGAAGEEAENTIYISGLRAP